METILDVQKLTAGYFQENKIIPIIHDIDLTLQKGELLGIIGESGSGKTTFSDSLLNVLPYKGGRIMGGTITYCGQPHSSCRIGQDLTYIPQDPSTALDPLCPISVHFDELCDLYFRDFNQQKRSEFIASLLSFVGLDAEKVNLKSYPHHLSGGMKQRILIALAIMPNPKCIIADEPTSNLDVTTEKMIMELFVKIRNEKGISFIFTTHNLRIAKLYCDRIYVFREGHIVEAERTQLLFAHPNHPYTKELLGSIEL
jgi:ABC-type dipeptide/oligopeptide/nickel transport system ATPase component